MKVFYPLIFLIVSLIFSCGNADSSSDGEAEEEHHQSSVSGSVRRSVTAASGAPQSNWTQGFSLEYTLITANSPDCEPPSTADLYPVRVQYRSTRIGDANRGSAGEWSDPPSGPTPILTGEIHSVVRTTES